VWAAISRRSRAGFGALALAVALLLVADTLPAADADYCGEYRFASGGLVSVLTEGTTAGTTRLVATIWESGRVGALLADTLDRFTMSPPDADGNTPTITFDRSPGGTIAALTLETPGQVPRHAPRVVTFHEEELLFTSGDATLSGTVKIPVGDGPFPGIVLVHGSGPAGRESVESMARFFVSIGFATLSYDKRGCGGSTGDWKTADLLQLARDALVGVAILRARDDVDPTRVGMWGISQGGWVAPIAASHWTSVAFVINHSGPATSLRRQDTFMMSRVLEMQDVPPDDIDLAVAALNTLYDYGRGKATAAQLDAAVAKTIGRAGLEDFATLTSENIIADSLYAQQPFGDPAWFLHLDPDRDALEPYRLLRCPVLVVYGRLDYTVPVEESVVALGSVFAQRGPADFHMAVLERTGHGMLVMDPEAPQNPALPLSLALEYFALLEDWLSARGF